MIAFYASACNVANTILNRSELLFFNFLNSFNEIIFM